MMDAATEATDAMLATLATTPQPAATQATAAGAQRRDEEAHSKRHHAKGRPAGGEEEESREGQGRVEALKEENARLRSALRCLQDRERGTRPPPAETGALEEPQAETAAGREPEEKGERIQQQAIAIFSLPVTHELATHELDHELLLHESLANPEDAANAANHTGDTATSAATAEPPTAAASSSAPHAARSKSPSAAGLLLRHPSVLETESRCLVSNAPFRSPPPPPPAECEPGAGVVGVDAGGQEGEVDTGHSGGAAVGDVRGLEMEEQKRGAGQDEGQEGRLVGGQEGGQEALGTASARAVLQPAATALVLQPAATALVRQPALRQVSCIYLCATVILP